MGSVTQNSEQLCLKVFVESVDVSTVRKNVKKIMFNANTGPFSQLLLNKDLP